jgi:hypothetical protein
MASPQAGQTIAGKYQLISPIGEGGMGVVWRARHLALGRDVAIKLIHEASGDRVLGERFLREARHAASVRHPNVVDVIDSGSTDAGLPFFVMELLEGRTLGARLALGRPPLGEVLRIAVGMLRGLAAVHAAGLLHRDLKPENVFLAAEAGEAVVKLLDFGVARSQGEHAAAALLTQPGTLLGTPAYMSIEQLRGAGDLDARSDLYAVGAILYEALAGQRPHGGATVALLIAAKLERDPEALLVLRPDLPGALCGIVHRALHRERAERFASATEMLQALVGEPDLAALLQREGVVIPRTPALHAVEGARALPASPAAPVAATEAWSATPRADVAPAGGVAVTAPWTGVDAGMPAPPPAAASPTSAKTPLLIAAALAFGVLGVCGLGALAFWMRGDAGDDGPRVTEAETPPSDRAASWILGAPAELPTLAAQWRTIESASARDAVRLVWRSEDRRYLPVMVEVAATEWATLAARRFGGTPVRGEVPAGEQLSLTLMQTGSVILRGGPTARAERVNALQSGVLVAGVRGRVGDTESPTTGTNAWNYIVSDGERAGWAFGDGLEEYRGCVPAVDSFLTELPVEYRDSALAQTSIRTTSDIASAPGQQSGFVMRFNLPGGDGAYVGLFASTPDCRLSLLGIHRVDHPIQLTYLCDAVKGTGPKLLIVRGPALTQGNERWQAFVVGQSGTVWSTTLRSDENLRSGRVRVRIAATTNDGVYAPVSAERPESARPELFVWDGTQLHASDMGFGRDIFGFGGSGDEFGDGE